jgi:hypothetical protein
MAPSGYIEEFEEIDDHRSNKIVVQLNGRINKTGVISPRFNVKLARIDQWVTQLLPARSFGYLVLVCIIALCRETEETSLLITRAFRRRLLALWTTKRLGESMWPAR